MASYIERRKFLATLGGAAVVWPLAAVIGYLGASWPGASPHTVKTSIKVCAKTNKEASDGHQGRSAGT